MENVDAALSPGKFRRQLQRHHIPLLGVAFVVFAAFALRYGAALWLLLQDQQRLEAAIERMGWMGPAALIAFNAAQIVVAPIPGYVVQIASGYLFGPIWGGLWASIGLMTGAMLAMWLSRVFGRPLAERLVGKGRLDKWETITHSDSVFLWFILILSPTGDLPYFLAGLSSTRFSTIMLLVMAIRVPTTFVVAAAGAGVLLLAWWQLALIGVALTALLLGFMRYQEPMTHWVDAQVLRKISRKKVSERPAAD